jgi:hypothetical protein
MSRSAVGSWGRRPGLARQVVVILAFGALAAVVAQLGDGAVWLVPALLIVAPLLAGWYPGEPLLSALRRTPPARRSGRVGSPRTSRIAPVRLPRGGSLIGAALAGRAPPAHS